MLKVTIIAPAGPVDKDRLERGIPRLRARGFDVTVHPQVMEEARFTAGPDEVRAGAFLEAARDPECDILWCARGGYGCTRLLPLLDDVASLPAKTLVGYSDITALHHLAAHRWGWRTIHGPMPAIKQEPPEEDWQATVDLLHGRPLPEVKLDWLTPPPAEPLEGPVIGGNLAVWNSMTGTPWQAPASGGLLFLEDVHEEGYAVDRMVVQLRQAGGFEGLSAIILGGFDDGASVEEVANIFLQVGLPVARGMPSGHGDRCWPIRLNSPHRLAPDGSFRMLRP